MSTFFDTNIFVYAVSQAPEDRSKRLTASGLIASGDFSLSVQVIQEFIHTCLRKARLGQTPDAVQATAEFLFTFPCALTSPDLVRCALALQGRYQFSYWDAAILAAAQELGCHTLYTEDLNPDQDYDGVRVINPFLSTAKNKGSNSPEVLSCKVPRVGLAARERKEHKGF